MRHLAWSVARVEPRFSASAQAIATTRQQTCSSSPISRSPSKFTLQLDDKINIPFRRNARRIQLLATSTSRLGFFTPTLRREVSHLTTTTHPLRLCIIVSHPHALDNFYLI